MKTGLIISMIIWVTAAVIAIAVGASKYKRKRFITSRNTMFTGTFLAASALLAPIYFDAFGKDGGLIRVVKTLLVSFHHTIRLFVIDSDFDIIIQAVEKLGENDFLATVYSTFAAVLFLCAPILSFDFILSFFKNISAYRKYLFKYFANAYVFSELNEKSVALARSILAKERGSAIVFTDVFDKNEESTYELVEQAKEIGAICFKNDILTVNFKLHSKKKPIYFFTIGEEDKENIEQSYGLVKSYLNRENTRLFFFSTSATGELIMTSANKGAIRVRRVDVTQSMIYRTLYEMETTVIQQRAEGVAEEDIKKDLFMNARPTEDGMKRIGAVVVGCGSRGSEMVRTLTWFCQMDGYRVSIDAFDRRPNAEAKLKTTCPELMDERYNGVYVEGEAQYMIHVHSGIDTDTSDFAERISELTDTTYVFVALGSDEENIKTAVDLRVLFERMGIHPIIQAIVESTETTASIEGICNFKGQAYDIDAIGDIRSRYSRDVIIDSELEEDALERHLKYGKESDFWTYEYNYRSSMASALHMVARIACGIAGAEKKEGELTGAEKDAIERLEHRRWNAYTRSIGYVYSGSPDKSSRNDLGKMHHNLVIFDDLSEEDKRKDSRVGSK